MNSSNFVEHFRGRCLHKLVDGGSGFIHTLLLDEYKDYLYSMDDAVNVKLYDITGLVWSFEADAYGKVVLNLWDAQTAQRIIGRMFLGGVKYDIITYEGARRIGFDSNKTIFLNPLFEKK